MNDREFIRLVMQEVGPREDSILEVLEIEETSWAVRFDEVDVDLRFDPETRRLELSTEICAVPAERREALYERLLIFNQFWRITGGLRMALAEPGGVVIQSLDLHCSAVTTELMAIVLHNLNERTRLWRGFILYGDGGAGADPEFREDELIQV